MEIERRRDSKMINQETAKPETTTPASIITTTYSMWSLFRNCRKACELRYVRNLVPVERDKNLSFGSLIHECLEIWHGSRNIEMVRAHIDRSTSLRAVDEQQKSFWHHATAMMEGYVAAYPSETFEVEALERKFTGEIINPDTGAKSRTFCMRGKVDGIVKQDNAYYILEHKTASVLDSRYLDKLWCDMQITLYSKYIEETYNIPVAGVIYNVLVKARLKQGAGETEAEFEARRAELIAKSKTGKSSATRKMPESDEDYQSRLSDKYREPGMFHRELLYISKDQFRELEAELWELTQAYLDARRRGTWYRNTAYCFGNYGRACPYFALCRSGENPNVEGNLYTHESPHGELEGGEQSAGSPVSAPMVF
jgi:hypothetical protein